MTSRLSSWRRPLVDGDALLLDIGATSVTGLRSAVLPRKAPLPRLVAHPIYATLPLGDQDRRALGSDCLRIGPVFDPPDFRNDRFIDAFGVSWLSLDEAPAPFDHPLQQASAAEISRHTRPEWPSRRQISTGVGDGILIADAPCPGLFDLCCALRNAWNFIDDVASRSKSATALLDWSLETVIPAYQHALRNLATTPDVVFYGDDFGFRGGMLISIEEFRTYFRPRLRILIDALRQLAPGAAICFHTCGAVAPLLDDIVALDIEIINLDSKARDMSIDRLRQHLPGDLILHGSTDLVALGRAIVDGDLASVALLTSDVALSLPAIAAPLDAIATSTDLQFACRANAYLRALGAEGLQTIARLGPVRDLIYAAMAKVRGLPPVTLLADAPEIADLTSSPPPNKLRAAPIYHSLPIGK